MLSKNDLVMIRGVVSELFVENNREWDKKLDQRFDAFEIRFADFKHEIRDEIHAVVNAAVFASENRLIRRMDVMQEEISDVINDGILPQIDEHTRQITVINRHFKFV